MMVGPLDILEESYCVSTCRIPASITQYTEGIGDVTQAISDTITLPTFWPRLEKPTLEASRHNSHVSLRSVTLKMLATRSCSSAALKLCSGTTNVTGKRQKPDSTMQNCRTEVRSERPSLIPYSNTNHSSWLKFERFLLFMSCAN